MNFLLDANALSELARNPKGACATWLRSVRDHYVFTSVVVAGEVAFGIANSQDFRSKLQMQAVMNTISVHALPAQSAELYGAIRSHLAQSGKPIGANDLWIAAHAIAEDATLVTANLGEFLRVPDLRAIRWPDS